MTKPNFSTAGVLHNDTAGLFSSSLIVDANVSATAAIAGTKISPNFGTQNVTTSGNISTTGLGTVTSAGLLTASNGLTVSSGTTTLSALSTGVVHANGSGIISSSKVVVWNGCLLRRNSLVKYF